MSSSRFLRVDEFLGDYEEGEKVFPWTLSGDAIWIRQIPTAARRP